MAKGKKNDLKKLQKELQESAHKIWLAGLGALSAAGETGSRVFQQLVEKGEGVEGESRARFQETREQVEETLGQARERIDARLKEAKTRVEGTVDDVLKKVDERFTEALHRFGVPTREEIQSLTQRVEELTRKVEQLHGKPTRKAAGSHAGAPVVFEVAAHEDGWKVEQVGTGRAASVHGTKDEAVQAARGLAQSRRPSQVVVYKKDGSPQTEYSYEVEAVQ
jgi:poly(hydroxyalkanoate) granule-associated protein